MKKKFILDKHYIAKVGRNTSDALLMSMEMTIKTRYISTPGIQELVQIIDSAALALKKVCRDHAHEIEESEQKAAAAQKQQGEG